MQVAITEFFEDFNAALVDAVRHIGGNKQVGALLWPELPPDQSAGRLRDCLNPHRREKLSPEQVLLICTKAREVGCHSAMAFFCFSAGYEPPRPVVPEDQEAELMRTFTDAVDRLELIQKQLNRVQVLRRAA
jgi:hypothetical protein